LRQVERGRGKFRTFLLAALKHFLANEWDRAQATKRGGNQLHVSLDDPSIETRYLQEATNQLSADRLFERRWALTLIDRALIRLREDFAAAGKGALFDHLKDHLIGEKNPEAYAKLAGKLRLTEGSLKVTVHRMRLRCRELVREQIAQTVASPEQIDEELQCLLQALKQ
jgi:RNA polymerase sigma-70 factor (ECF subfamily)